MKRDGGRSAGAAGGRQVQVGELHRVCGVRAWKGFDGGDRWDGKSGNGGGYGGGGGVGLAVAPGFDCHLVEYHAEANDGEEGADDAGDVDPSVVAVGGCGGQRN